MTLSKLFKFVYGYMLFKAFFFSLKTRVNEVDYPNAEYVSMWRSFLRGFRERELKRALNLILENSDALSECSLEIFDCFDRSSYFALIHPNHPNVTLGFIKDSDLWDIWLKDCFYKLVREKIADLIGIGDDVKILDLGCGSVSPSFYGELVSSNGIYTGIDFSKPLLNLAMARVKEGRLSDRVNLIWNYVDSKLLFKRRYDIVICSSVLQYTNVKSTMQNAVRALGGDGLVVVFSEVFSDVHKDYLNLFNLYYSLIPSFKAFPSIEEIRNCVLDCRIKVRDHIALIEISK